MGIGLFPFLTAIFSAEESASSLCAASFGYQSDNQTDL